MLSTYSYYSESYSQSYFVMTDRYGFRLWTQGHPRRPWLLFLHGFLGNRFEFAAVMEDLGRDFFCVAPDLPGHGKTIVADSLPLPLIYGMDSTAQGVMQCLGGLYQQLGCPLGRPNLGKIGLVGYSMGGRLGLYLLLNRPQAFWGGVVESASPGLETFPQRSCRLRQDYDRAEALESLDNQGFQQFLQQWYGNPLFQGLPEHPQYPLLLQHRQTGNPKHLAQSLRYLGLGAQPSLWFAWSHNPLPITLVGGEWDHKFVALNQAMADRCPRSQFRIIPNASHNTHWVNAPEFIQVIRSFTPKVLDKGD